MRETHVYDSLAASLTTPHFFVSLVHLSVVYILAQFSYVTYPLGIVQFFSFLKCSVVQMNKTGNTVLRPNFVLNLGKK